MYSSTGVCEVEDITKLSDIRHADRNKLYYILKPLYQNGQIFVPVDTDKIFMRPVLTKQEANDLIDLIPSLDAEAFFSGGTQQLVEHYKQSISTHKCEDLVKLLRSIYLKKQSVLKQKRKFGQVDEAYMKQAEELLYGELAVSLGIQKSEVQAYIDSRIGAENKED